MTKKERDALIERARKTPWLDEEKRRETEALLEALDEATRQRDAAEVRGARRALDACYLAIERGSVPPISPDAGQRARDAARICNEPPTETLERMVREAKVLPVPRLSDDDGEGDW